MTSWTNGLDISVGGIRKLRVVGAVVANAEIDDTLTAIARQNPAPLYPLAIGSEAGNYNYVKDGDVAFSMTDTDGDFHEMTSTMNYRHNVDKIRVISVLNGQGNIDDDPEVLMQQVVVHGIIESGTADNGKTIFNVLRAGMLTGENTDKNTIYAGDPLEAYMPPREEIEAGAPVKLRMRTFVPERHKNTPKAIYKCLRDPDQKEHYLPSYIAHCNKYVDEAMEKAAIGHGVVFGDDAAYKFYLQLKKNREQFIDKLFETYSSDSLPDSRSLGAETASQVMQRMRRETAGKSLATLGYLVHMVNKNVQFQALTTAMPGHNMDYQIKSYGLQ